MPILALLTKLATDHEAAGESALAFTSDAWASRHFRVSEAAHDLISALIEVDGEEPPCVVKVVPIAPVASEDWVLHP